MQMRKLIAATAVAALGLVTALPAGATPTLTLTEVTRAGNTATVTGEATFADLTAQPVGGNLTLGTVGNTPAAGPAGLVLEEGRIVPLANGSGLRFIWEVTDMPAEVPPEGVRYNWTFAIGGKQFQLQAKRTNMASVTTTEDPVGHVQHAAKNENFFQLRGNCQTQYQGLPIAGCYHLAFLGGGFDVEARTIHMDVPFETRDGIGRLVAPEFKPGAVLEASATAGASIVAGAQAVASTSDTGTFINDWNSYFVGPMVQLGVGTATTSPANANYTSTATLNSDGTFSGTVTGLTAQATRVFVRACNGVECAYASD